MEVSRTARLIGSKTAFGLPARVGSLPTHRPWSGGVTGKPFRLSDCRSLRPLKAPRTPFRPPIVLAPAAAAPEAPTDDVPWGRTGENTRGPSLRKAEATFGRLLIVAACVSRVAEPAFPW